MIRQYRLFNYSSLSILACCYYTLFSCANPPSDVSERREDALKILEKSQPQEKTDQEDKEVAVLQESSQSILDQMSVESGFLQEVSTDEEQEPSSPATELAATQKARDEKADTAGDQPADDPDDEPADHRQKNLNQDSKNKNSPETLSADRQLPTSELDTKERENEDVALPPEIEPHEAPVDEPAPLPVVEEPRTSLEQEDSQKESSKAHIEASIAWSQGDDSVVQKPASSPQESQQQPTTAGSSGGSEEFAQLSERQTLLTRTLVQINPPENDQLSPSSSPQPVDEPQSELPEQAAPTIANDTAEDFEDLLPSSTPLVDAEAIEQQPPQDLEIPALEDDEPFFTTIHDQIKCTSNKHKPTRCRTTGKILAAKVEQSIGATPCIQGDTFGFKNRTLWVKKSCGAIFNVYYHSEGFKAIDEPFSKEKIKTKCLELHPAEIPSHQKDDQDKCQLITKIYKMRAQKQNIDCIASVLTKNRLNQIERLKARLEEDEEESKGKATKKKSDDKDYQLLSSPTLLKATQGKLKKEQSQLAKRQKQAQTALEKLEKMAAKNHCKN